MLMKWKAENLLTHWAEVCNFYKVAANLEASPPRLQKIEHEN